MNKQYLYSPEKDITTYELSQLFKLIFPLTDVFHVVSKLEPEVKRHLKYIEGSRTYGYEFETNDFTKLVKIDK